MKRRQMLQLLGLVPSALLATSCKDNLPTTATIVTGKIIDENGNPLEGAGLGLSGANLKGFSGANTFAITTESDKNGMFELSQVAPQDTEEMHILPRTTVKVPLDIGIGDYVSYFLVEGNYEKITGPYDIPRSSWGKTITLNYQFRKR